MSRRAPLVTAAAALCAALVPAAAAQAAPAGPSAPAVDALPAESRVDLLSMVGNDGHVYYKRTDEGVWRSLGGDVASAPVVVPTPYGLTFLVVGKDGRVYGRTLEEGWRALGPAGPACTDLAASFSGGADLDVVCRGEDGGVYTGTASVPQPQPGPGALPWQLGGFTSWSSLGGQVTAVAATTDGGRVVYAVTDAGDVVRRGAADASWTPASDVTCGGGLAASRYDEALSCAQPQTRALVSVVAPDGSSGTVVPGSRIAGEPDVVVDPDGVSRHYALGEDGRLYAATQDADGTMHPFATAGGLGKLGVSAISLTQPPTGSPLADEQRYTLLSMTGNDTAVYTRFDDESTWHGLGGSVASAPVIVPTENGTLFLAVGNDGNVYARSYEQSWRAVAPQGTRCTDLAADVVGGYVFCRGTDRQVYYADLPYLAASTTGGTWSIAPMGAWDTIGGDVRAVAGAFDTDSRALALGQDYRLYVSPGYDGEDWQQITDVRCASGLAASPLFESAACVAPGSRSLVTLHDSVARTVVGSDINGEPAVAVDSDGVGRYYALGQDGNLYVARQDADGTLHGFAPAGGTGRFGVSAISYS